MKLLSVVVVLLLVLPAAAGEVIGGTNAYIATPQTWKTGLYSGYYIYDSTGTTVWQSGPLQDGPVECHGAGFWTSEEILGEGICIFDAEADRWTVAFELTVGRNLWDQQEKHRFHREREWRVVHGTGRYVGMTGSGTFVSDELADGRKTTWFAGEVEFAN